MITSHTAIRFGVATAAAVLFLAAARLADPAPSVALPQASMSEAALSVDEPDGVYLGALEGADHALRIYATNAGPRFQLLDLSDSVVVSDLRGDEIYRFLPGFDYFSTVADVDDAPLLLDSPLMTADLE